MAETEDRPQLGELFRRQERLERQISELDRSLSNKLDELNRANERHYQELSTRTEFLSKELYAANQVAFKELQSKIQDIDKRITVSETTQKMTVALMSTVAAIVTTAIIQFLVQFLTRHSP